MRFRDLVVLVLVALFGAAPAWAQAITVGPLPATSSVVWEAPANVTTVADALSFEPRLYKNGQALTALTGQTCTLAGSIITCQAPVSPSNRDAINQVGAWTLTLSLFRADVGEGPQSSPFVFRSPAGAPTALRIQ